ncbi:MAG: polysaccharide export protein [Alphaproteobacteria bacterium]|nr:polysaccharide export protein [Alphaproteobacteria bacterium]
MLVWAGTASLAGCSGTPTFLPSSGPDKMQVETKSLLSSSVKIIDINDDVARRVSEARKKTLFSEVFGDDQATDYSVGAGDLLSVVIWEAQPSALFMTPVTKLPPQMVERNGKIDVPFAGQIQAAGKSPHQIETEIVKRLHNKAHQPQVLVQVAHNFSSNVTVVGEVGQSTRMQLTAKGERLLDALAMAGGVRQAFDKMTIQITRNGKAESMPLSSITRDPKQNIYLNAGDVVTALYQPLSFTAMGATGQTRTGQSSEINFEAKGITLSQAIGRIGGLSDDLADPQGIFIFRFEDPAAVEDDDGKPLPHNADGKVPVVYRLDLKDPGSFLIAQNFPVRDKDIIYIADAPAVEFQKFMNILFTSVFSINRLMHL